MTLESELNHASELLSKSVRKMHTYESENQPFAAEIQRIHSLGWTEDDNLRSYSNLAPF